MKHAPRGPMKARPDPMHHGDLIHHGPNGGEARRCHATTRKGKPCPNPAIKGATVCRMHGGSAPQVRAAAEFRVNEAYKALQPKAVAVVAALLDRDEYPTVQMAAVRDVMDRTEGKAIDTVKHVGGDGGPVEFVVRAPWRESEKP